LGRRASVAASDFGGSLRGELLDEDYDYETFRSYYDSKNP
jgi:hypothetical protein